MINLSAIWPKNDVWKQGVRLMVKTRQEFVAWSVGMGEDMLKNGGVNHRGTTDLQAGREQQSGPQAMLTLLSIIRSSTSLEHLNPRGCL